MGKAAKEGREKIMMPTLDHTKGFLFECTESGQQ